MMQVAAVAPVGIPATQQLLMVPEMQVALAYKVYPDEQLRQVVAFVQEAHPVGHAVQLLALTK